MMMINPLKDFASGVSSVVSVIANFFGLNIKNFYSLYSKSSELRTKVDRLAEDYLRKYEDKIATSTPSTTPSIAKFIQSQLEKDKDTVLALQRRIQELTDKIESDKNNIGFDYHEMDRMKKSLDQATNDYNNVSKHLTNQKVTTAIVRGSENRFTNADRANKWKDKQPNAIQKVQQ